MNVGTNILEIEFMITCRSVGVSGTFYSFMKMRDYGVVLALGNSEYVTQGSGSADTTGSMDLDVKISGIGVTNFSIQIEQAIIEYKN